MTKGMNGIGKAFLVSVVSTGSGATASSLGFSVKSGNKLSSEAADILRVRLELELDFLS